MDNSAPDSLRLSPKQDELLEEIKFYKEKIQKELQRLPTRPPDNLYLTELAVYYGGPEFSRLRKLRQERDNLTVKAIRSFFRRVSGQKGYPGMYMKFIEDKEGNYEVTYVPGESIQYHPGLPRWALDYFCLWIHEKRCIRNDRDYYLLTDCKMGLETGLKPPKDLTLLEKVLLARGLDYSEKVIEKLTRYQPLSKKLTKKNRKR
jgi:hypothetical protein